MVTKHQPSTMNFFLSCFRGFARRFVVGGHELTEFCFLLVVVATARAVVPFVWILLFVIELLASVAIANVTILFGAHGMIHKAEGSDSGRRPRGRGVGEQFADADPFDMLRNGDAGQLTEG